MNLAEFKYRNILSIDGGPVESIHYTKHSNYDGHNFFAKLKPGLIVEEHNLKIYQSSGGQGTCFSNKSTALHKAISEALEYWAFFEIKNNFSKIQKSKYGFDIDPTSNGMACFPGLFARSTRNYALNEAIERWSLIAWWGGLLPIKQINDSSYEIITPWKNLRTIVLKSKSLIHKKHIYAFATDKSLPKAAERARSELYRNSRVIDTYYDNPTPNLESTMEKRLIYFSSVEGEKHFREIILSSFKIKTVLPEPKLVVDSKIPGPWDKYAYLWRCLFTTNSNHFYDSTNDKYFYF